MGRREMNGRRVAAATAGFRSAPSKSCEHISRHGFKRRQTEQLKTA